MPQIEQQSSKEYTFDLVQPKQRQKLILKKINYKSLKRKSQKSNDRTLKNKEQFINFKDDSVMHYFQNDKRRRMKSILFQRIKDSSTYILLFPTGLLMLLSTDLFSIQAKLQLNIKREEPIIDHAYCV